MTKRGSGSKKPDHTPRRPKRPLEERVAIHAEWAKTIRVGFIVAGVFGSIWIIKDGVVELVKDSPWVQALKLVAALVLGPVPLSLVMYKYRQYILRFTLTNITRTSQLEKEIDPERTSSSLLEDGTDPPGAFK